MLWFITTTQFYILLSIRIIKVINMSKTEITSAIEKTIEEARKYQQENPDDNSLAIQHMDEYRRSLEAKLDLYDAVQPSPLRALVTSITIPAGFVLAPVTIAGFLAYTVGRKIYEGLKNRK